MASKFIVILMVSVWACGCSMVRTYVADLDENRAFSYCEAKRTNPEIKPIVGKLPIVSADEITPEMLANDATPSPAEVNAILALSRDQHDCRDKMQLVTHDHWPTQTATMKARALKFDLVTSELIKRKMTFGNANRLYQEAALEAEGKLTAERKEQLDKAREQEAIAWRTVGDGIRAIAGSQTPEPTQDPCTWAGNTVDCGGN